MKKNNLNTLKEEISSFFLNGKFEKKIAVVIIGSVLRNDYEVNNRSGDFLSDVDILIVIKQEDDIKSINQQVKNGMNKISCKYDLKISISYTLYTKILTRRGSLFLQGVSPSNFIFDSLNVAEAFRKTTSKKQKIEDLLQGVFYYQAKYNLDKSYRQSFKINKLILCSFAMIKGLKTHLTYSLNDDVLSKELEHSVLNQYGVMKSNEDKLKEILKSGALLYPSSLFFLQNQDLPPNILYENVRNIVFMENQGFDFYTSTQSTN